MKKLIPLLFLLPAIFCSGQTYEAQTTIKAENIYELSIIRLYPDSFPNVSVIFQAKNRFGKPLWTLDKSEISVTENEKWCAVTGLKNISENKPLNIGLVFDHSGSMVDNPAQMPKGVETMQYDFFAGIPFPKNYTMAIDYAKEGVSGFLRETTGSSDSILFVGFSNTVDQVFPLTNNIKEIDAFVNRVLPAGSTAYYDALYLSIDLLSKNYSKAVVVALTDGQDNASAHTVREVIAFARQKKIGIYVIGLGNVDESPLKELSDSTGGFYYYTNNPETLKEIYLNIKAQIKSIYQLDYTSASLDFLETNRNIRFAFTNDTLQFSNNAAFYSLPEETRVYLQLQDEIRLRNRFIFGGLGVLLLGLGSFLVYKWKFGGSGGISLQKVFPNPFETELTVELEAPATAQHMELVVSDTKGVVVRTIPLAPGETSKSLSLGDLAEGVYLIQVVGDAGSSNTVKVVKK
ncbi:MAG: VWA domain-containing protein [Saprospiraceae bacterium]|nr:VWA domain-containing protein [Saprospiraceae bacterium]